MSDWLATLNAILWHETVLYVLLATGILFTVRSGFCQYRVLTHGFHVIRGRYDDPGDPGAINHFQALSAALSATVGLGNIGGVALAISLGGPGAVFWMWVVGFFGMAIKLTEVTLSMLYRNTNDPDNPHGGPMWVIRRTMKKRGGWRAQVGRALGVLFCITLLVSTATGGNMFQAWNVGEITETYFGVPSVGSGIVLAVVVGMVIIGGIKRIGAVAGTLVPAMVALYLLASIYVLAVNWQALPDVFSLIMRGAFSSLEAKGAFIGGTMGYAFLFGMKRALFSSEAGQGSSPIAHSAAKTDEPVREGIVAGLEPFIDTLVVCTLTALVILSTGIWNRGADDQLPVTPQVLRESPATWSLGTTLLADDAQERWSAGESVYTIVTAHLNPATGANLHRLSGIVIESEAGLAVEWTTLASPEKPQLETRDLYASYVGATLTAQAFDRVTPGLGKWLVTLAVWLFALSTMISWSYYGEQGIVFLVGERGVLPYKIAFCLLIIVSTLGLMRTDAQIDAVTSIGTAVMLFVNVPMLWVFGSQAMTAYHNYVERLKTGRMGPGHAPPSLEDLLSGKDVE